MADLNGVNDTLPVRVGGVSSTSGLPDNYADVNAGGSLQIAGQGVAGTPAGGVVSIQGVTGGTAVPASQSGTWNITNISGTITLPTGASTSSNQTTEITSLQLIDNPIGSVVAGTAGTSSNLIGLIYNTTLPAATNGQQMAAQSDLSGRILVNDTANISSQYQALTISTTAVLAIGGGSVLANRKALFITATTGTVYWGTSNTVTTTTGQPLQFGQSITLNFGPTITVYLIAAISTNVRVTEVS